MRFAWHTSLLGAVLLLPALVQYFNGAENGGYVALRTLLLFFTLTSFALSTCLRKKKVSLFALPMVSVVIVVFDVLAFGNFLEDYGVVKSEDLPSDFVSIITGVITQNFFLFYDFRWQFWCIQTRYIITIAVLYYS